MTNRSCCQPRGERKETAGLSQGLIYGLLPHSFCIGFIIFSALGVTVFSTVFRRFLLVPHFFEALIGFSFILATASVLIYLKRLDRLNLAGVKSKWQYLLVLYGTTIIINFLFLTVIFPALVNFNSRPTVLGQNNLVTKTLDVQIPCSGHAFLISEELKKLEGVTGVYFNQQGHFEVSFDPERVSLEQILGASIFKTYAARVLS